MNYHILKRMIEIGWPFTMGIAFLYGIARIIDRMLIAIRSTESVDSIWPFVVLIGIAVVCLGFAYIFFRLAYERSKVKERAS